MMVSDFPRIINVEVYRGDCPCSCVHCPVGMTEKSERKKRFKNKGMNLSLYKKVVDELSGHPESTIRIHSVGEPLLWLDLQEAAEVSHNAGVTSWLFTSAVMTNKSLLESLCDNISIIEVSVNSTGREDYKATKGVDQFQLVADNIEAMHNYIHKSGLQTRLLASRVQSNNAVADQAFVEYWKASGLVADSFVRSYHTYNDLISQLSSGDGKTANEPCLVHWARFNISVNGYAIVCFNELFKENPDPSLIYGNINTQTIGEVWRGQRLAAVRRAGLTGNYSGLDNLPCKDCTSCQPLFGKRQTAEYQITKLKE